MSLSACHCGLNFYHCDGRCRENNKEATPELDWWNPKELAQRLKELRRISGKTLRQVEKATKIPSGTISQIENGRNKNPSYISVYRLKAFYDKELTRLIGKNKKKIGRMNKKLAEIL